MGYLQFFATIKNASVKILILISVFESIQSIHIVTREFHIILQSVFFFNQFLFPAVYERSMFLFFFPIKFKLMKIIHGLELRN